MAPVDGDLVVIVLGAGTSACCGYPMARDFFPRLAGFGESLGPSCPKIKRAIEYVTGEATSAGN
jgi:hypothetical protein